MKRILIATALLQSFVLFSSSSESFCKDIGGTEVPWKEFLIPEELFCDVQDEKEINTSMLLDIVGVQKELQELNESVQGLQEIGIKLTLEEALSGSLMKIPCYDNYENFVDTENEFSYSEWLRFSFFNGNEEAEEYVCFSPNCFKDYEGMVYLFKLDKKYEKFKQYSFFGEYKISYKDDSFIFEGSKHDKLVACFQRKTLIKNDKEYLLKSFFYL